MPPQPLPMATQQQFLAQQNAAYAAQQAAAGPYMMPGQDGNPFMTMLAPPSYYGVPPWVYPAGLIPQQGTQPRRPLTPSQGAENQPFVSLFYSLLQYYYYYYYLYLYIIFQ
jgi:pumilio RNA-binding family